MSAHDARAKEEQRRPHVVGNVFSSSSTLLFICIAYGENVFKGVFLSIYFLIYSDLLET